MIKWAVIVNDVALHLNEKKTTTTTTTTVTTNYSKAVSLLHLAHRSAADINTEYSNATEWWNSNHRVCVSFRTPKFFCFGSALLLFPFVILVAAVGVVVTWFLCCVRQVNVYAVCVCRLRIFEFVWEALNGQTDDVFYSFYSVVSSFAWTFFRSFSLYLNSCWVFVVFFSSSFRQFFVLTWKPWCNSVLSYNKLYASSTLWIYARSHILTSLLNPTTNMIRIYFNK